MKSTAVLNKILDIKSALVICFILVVGGAIHAIIFNNPNTVLLPMLILFNVLLIASLYHEMKKERIAKEDANEDQTVV